MSFESVDFSECPDCKIKNECMVKRAMEMNEMSQLWRCVECGHEVMTTSGEKPMDLNWKDNHVCNDWERVETNGD